MTVTINGTSGVTAPEVTLDNSAADGGQVVLKSSGYSNWNIDNYNGSLRSYYGSTVATTIDSSGNVGIGVTPSAWGSGWTALQIKAGGSALWTDGNARSFYTTNGYFNGTNRIYVNTAAACEYRQDAGNHSWLIAPSGTAGNAISFTQAMTLDSSGNLLVGTTSSISAGKIGVIFAGATENGIALRTSYASNGSNFAHFSNSAGNVAGYINQTGTTTVAYTSVSDYRLKENIQPMTGALALVQQLNPVTYTWKSDGSDGQGFIAHELQAVVPDCVTGEKDAVDAEGKPVYQGIDTSFLVATLTKAIQEQQAQIETLTAKVAALETK